VDHGKDFGALYGAFAGILVLLLWLWTSACALLVGAVIDRLLAETSGVHLSERRRRSAS
jgi:uncharacterized BrkB/YihY/UPF0761 family membrane protein